MAPEVQPVLEPADHALLLSPEQIRNRGSNNTNVSFLRKTQYMTSQNARANDPLMRSTSRSAKANKTKKTAIPAVSRDDPTYIKRHIQKGFEIAYPGSATPANSTLETLPISASDRDAWRKPTHPSNPKLKPLDFFPLLPDLPAKTDSNSFVSVKFDKPPLPALPNGKRDNRVDVAILHPARVEEVEREWKMKKEAYDKNKHLYEDPGRLSYDWDFCVPRLEGTRGDKDIVDRIRRKLNVADPRHDDQDLYVNREKGRFEYERVRTFAEDSAPMTHGWRYLALSLFDPDSLSSPSSGLGTRVGKETYSRLKNTGQGKAAYYYEIGQRMRLKADRLKTLAQARTQGGQAGKMAAVDNEDSVDGIDVLIREPDPDEMLLRAETRATVDREFRMSAELEELRRAAKDRANQDEEEGDADGDPDEAPKTRPTQNGSGLVADQDWHGHEAADRTSPGADTGAEPADVEMADADADADDE